MTFLQITTVAAPTAEVPETASSISLLDLLMKGGWVMIPVLALSLIAVYVIVERFIALSRAARKTTGLTDSIRSAVHKGDLNAAQMAASKYETPAAVMLLKGIKRIGSPLKEIESAMENTGRVELMKLEQNMSLLGIVAAIAPMLGFVGTISGVIKIFYNISLADNISIGLIAGGLYEKMVTSATGLIVGIIAHAGYQLLNMKIETITLETEKAGVEFMDIITEHN